MNCPYCKKEAPWISNEVVYGKRYGKSYMCYYCKDCDAYVGCHENTKKPLGTMANKELRQWRMKAHRAVDPIWKDKFMSRGKVYQQLSDRLGYPVHIGESDIQQCEAIIEVAKQLCNKSMIF